MRLLEALDPRWQVTVILFSPGELESQLRQRGIAVRVLPLAQRTASRGRAQLKDPRTLLLSGRDSWGFVGRLAQLLRAEQAELVVANTLKAAVLGSLAARRARCPWVWHLHDRISADYLPAAAVPALRLLARTAHGVVANSHATARLVRLPAERVAVAYPGLPEESFAAAHQAPPTPVFGMLGRISSTKGQREFLQAAFTVAAADPSAAFHIVGQALFNDHEYAKQLEDLTSQLDLAGRVRFAGWSARPEADLDRFSALVHASPVPEPFGQVIAEAMARGVPVIATAAGGAAEILTEAPDPVPAPSPGEVLRTPLGQLVAPGDPRGLASAMRWVIDNPGDAESAAQRASASARRRFGAASAAAVCGEVWSQALAAASPRRRRGDAG